ncbi:MAG: SAM-dependent methyltransferase [Moraxellaceae bacterium]|nr:MAG: SAM-dependent methyltransferase [Moraxellaceae bacterium]
MKETILARQQKWDQRYQNNALQAQACSLLIDFHHYLPPSGLALDLACGLGGNAIFLSQRGFTVSAWDFSQQAISRLEAIVKQQQLPITPKVIDVFENPPPENSFDVIVVSYFLASSIFDPLKNALKPNGVLFYQSHNLDSPSHGGPKNSQFLLKDNQLVEHFNGLTQLETFERPQHCPNKPGQSGIIVKN